MAQASGRFIVNVSEGKGQQLASPDRTESCGQQQQIDHISVLRKSLKDANLVPLVAESAGLSLPWAVHSRSSIFSHGCAHQVEESHGHGIKHTTCSAEHCARCNTLPY